MNDIASTNALWRIAGRGSPYRGLEPYEPRHAEVFFGREREVERGRERLLAAAAGGTGFLLVVGPSGAGKSSLVRAGLVPRLTQAGDIDGVDVVRVALMRPADGATPQRALAEALLRTGALPELAGSGFPEPERLAATLMGEADVAAAPILDSLAQAGAGRLLLVIDQLDELLSGAARVGFIRLIAELARSGRVLVVATLRSSSYDALAREPELMALKDAGAALDVAVPGADVLAGIVRRPAAAAGLAFDRRGDQSLDDVLLAAAGGNADALPLLGFTLQWLFENRDGNRLTFAAYDRLGGLEGAIGRAAERAFDGVDPQAQAALPRLLRGLAAAPRRDTGIALRDLPLSAVPDGTPARRLVDALVAARIVLIHGEGPGAMVRLAHDAALRGWERARDIAVKREDYDRIRADVMVAAQRWRDSRRGDLLLAPGLRLAEAQLLRAAYGAELAPDLVAFIDKSSRKEHWRRRRGYLLAGAFAVVAGAAIGVAIFAWREQPIAAHERPNAIAERARAARAARGPSNAAVQREAYLSVIKVGDALAAQGGLTGALAAYRESLDIMRALAAKEPGNAVLQHNVYVSLIKVGETLLAQGDRTGALAAFRESLDIARALAAKDPGNTQWQTDAVLSLWRLASAGDDPRGRWTDALAILTRLKSQNQLTAEQEGWIGTIEGEIAKLPQAERQ